jgi:hypothetical protein
MIRGSWYLFDGLRLEFDRLGVGDTARSAPALDGCGPPARHEMPQLPTIDRAVRDLPIRRLMSPRHDVIEGARVLKAKDGGADVTTTLGTLFDCVQKAKRDRIGSSRLASGRNIVCKHWKTAAAS